MCPRFQNKSCILVLKDMLAYKNQHAFKNDIINEYKFYDKL